MHSFFYDGLKTVRPGDTVSLSHEEEKHLFRILRAADGDRVMLLDGHGEMAEAEVSGKKLAVLTRTTETLPDLRLHLYLAPPRRQKMEQLLKQAAELGVYRVVTFFSERSVALPAGENARSRQEALLTEACKQSGNPFLPVCDGPVKFADALTDAKTRCPLCFFGAPAEPGSLRPADLAGDCAFFVGPEGGFTETEERQMKESGFRPLRIGRRILRVETAAVAGLAVLAAAERQ
jgi:16S rRNA (uracil1498-N3)-methyltransferase